MGPSGSEGYAGCGEPSTEPGEGGADKRHRSGVIRLVRRRRPVTLGRVMRRQRFGIFLVLAASLLAAAMARGAERPVTELTIDLRDQAPPFRGWGTSLAWWARGVGDWPEKTLDDLVRLVTDPHDGLGLTVFRYNIGGGDRPEHHHLRHWGDIPGFKAAPDAPYDWNADAAQRRVLLKLLKAAGDAAVVEGFSNSPPWWMTASGCVSGAADGGANLKPEFEPAFADYLAEVAKAYKQRYGVTFASLSPMNEPDVKWWKAGGNQEGMHVPRDQQARLVRLARAALDQRGLRNTRVSANDANSIDDALAALRSFDAATRHALGQVNTHSYNGSKRADLRDAADACQKPVWVSETGPLYLRGSEYEQLLQVAQRLVIDINDLRPEVWCTWQIVDRGPWGCVHESRAPQTFDVGKAFDVLAAFTRHIRPGDRFVKLKGDSVLAAVSAARGEVTLVLVNRDRSPQPFRLRFDNAPRITADAAGECTSADKLELSAVAPVPIRSDVLETITPAQSVTRLSFRVAG